jgi:hypothetical protein
VERTTEFRFVLPLLPPTLVYAGYCLRNLENRLYVQLRERTQRNLLLAAVFAIIVPNIGAAYYLSRVHQAGFALKTFITSQFCQLNVLFCLQRAPSDVMDFLANRIQGKCLDR